MNHPPALKRSPKHELAKRDTLLGMLRALRARVPNKLRARVQRASFIACVLLLLPSCASSVAPVGDAMSDALDATNADVPNADVPNVDVPNVDVPNVDVPSGDVTNDLNVPEVDGHNNDVPNVMDVPDALSDTGICPMGTSACGVVGCVNLQSDLSNCGMCGNACVVPNGSPSCADAVCRVASCNAEFQNCDNVATNGCEANTTTDVAHCGACANACPAIVTSTAICSMSTCSFACDAGFALLGGRCVAVGAFPRPILPLSLGDVSLRRPTLRWELPLGTDGAAVELCRDRPCTMVIETVRVLGTSVRPTMALPPRSVVFWRLRATVGAVTSVTLSPTWLFHVPATDNSGNVDTSSNPHLDVNGDGFDDVVVGAPSASASGRGIAGTTSVFHGSAMGIVMAPARVLEGVAEFDGFGGSVASAGDVNGDGFGDLVVGAIRSAPGGRFQAGTASVFHGSAMGIPIGAAIILEGVAAGDYFGYSVATARERIRHRSDARTIRSVGLFGLRTFEQRG